MNHRIFIVGLLFAAFCIPFLTIPNANSQSTATTTMTIQQPPSQGQCSEISLPFFARAGEEIIGIYGSDVSINFYILSQDDLNAITDCRLPASARPIFIEEKSVGHNNPYRYLAFPADGTYYFVFIYVRGPTQLASGYATVELGYPSSVTIMGITGSSSIAIASTSTSPLTTSSSLTPTVISSSLTPTTTNSPMSTTVLTPTTTSSSPASTEAPPVSSIGNQFPLTTLLLIIAGVVIAGVVIGAKLFRNRKGVSTLSSYLEKIDSTYNEYAVDREECRARLERLKRDVIEMLNKRTIDEGHFLMLDEKITEYLKDLSMATKHKRGEMDDETHAGQNGVPIQDSKFCSNCGAKMLLEDKVCKKCGTTQQ